MTGSVPIRLAAPLAALSLLLLTPLPVFAQENRICFACHGREGLPGASEGRGVVKKSAYERSVHGGLACVKCHQDIDAEDLPHDEELKPADCRPCHAQQVENHLESLHGQAAARGDALAPSCVTCHGAHDILPRTDEDSPTWIMNVPRLCGGCHHEGSEVSLTHEIPQERILENYSQSIHGEGLLRQGLTVTAVCTSCHTSHRILPHTDPRSSIHPLKVAETCRQCHGLIEEVHRETIEGRDWETEQHKIPACVDCHAPHKPRRPDQEGKKRKFYQAQTDDCLKCHGDRDLSMTRDGKVVSLFVDRAAYLGAAHGDTPCAKCHTDISPVTILTPFRERACDTVERKVDCSNCHDEALEYRSSTHGTLHAAGDLDAPTCLDCHARHATQSRTEPSSPTYPRNVPDLCARCHRSGERAAVRIEAAVDDIVEAYEDSIHGKGLLESGLVVTATCSSCHGAHGELPADHPDSRINRRNIAGTCGKCHHGIQEVFAKSIHGAEEGDASEDLPSCADCHSAHTIRRTDLPGFRLEMKDECGKCHTEELATYEATIHGQKTAIKYVRAAKCHDCHGTHDILPVTHPDSTLSKWNIVETCSDCHPGAHERFTGYFTHATHHDPDKYPYLYWTFWGMTALLVGTLAFASLHTLAWLTRLWMTRGEWVRHRPEPGEKLYRRFGRLQRTMHLLMLLSFFTLALTGMSLKFAYMGWAQVISSILGGARSMAILHRMGAITLFVILCLHAWDVRRKKMRSGRTWWRTLWAPDSIIFNRRDLREFGQSVKWFLGRGPRPRYGRYTYWEKFDYFAVFWGILVIGLSGLMLWFPVFFTRLVPGWFLNVATIIHSDEALLAIGFIFTIHFFNTHFRPDRFPMDPVIFTGRISVEELKRDKPDEYDRLVRNGELEENLVDPFPKPAERAVKIFGFVFLGIGLTLIGLIVYTMLFGYR